MSGEEKTHTQGEVDILIAMERVVTLQCVMNDDFKDHKKEDDEHFDNLYDADKEILSEISKIPENMIACSEKIKTDILSISRKEFVTATDIETYKGTVKETIAEMRGSLRTTYIMMGTFQSILLILLATWIKSNGA